MASVSLPELPKGKEFEEFLAAYFQSCGLYVERNVIDRQEEEVLELDFLTTEYREGVPPDIKLFEVKSGKWGFGDLFKIRGWLEYIKLDSGALLVNRERSPLEFYTAIGKKIGVEIVCVSDLSRTSEALENFLVRTDMHDADIWGWRFSYWVERELLKLLTAKKKCAPARKCYPTLDTYFSHINNRTFFTPNVIRRAMKLYEAFRQFPNISAKLGHELQGEDFDQEYDSVPDQLFRETYYECRYTDLAISTFIEHRARLSILKSAIDYKCYKETRGDEDQRVVFKFGDQRLEVALLDLLPDSFREGLNKIAQHKYYFRYPVFWQWFLWLFGGFILKDYEEQEYELLSAKTRIPRDEIPNALQTYDILFPLPARGSWFVDARLSSIRFIKLFSVPFMGIGANYRRWVYTDDGKYESLKVSGPHTLDNVIKWGRVAVDILSRNI